MKKVLLLSVYLIVSVLLGGGKLWADDNVTFTKSDDGTTLTITLTGAATDEDASAVTNQMNTSDYTKVVVVGGTINDKFIQSIIYGYDGNNDAESDNVNENITILDLSQTSYTETTFNKSSFNTSAGWEKGKLKITSLSLPSNITTIGEESVQLENLTEVILPDGLKTIGTKAFMNTKLTSITFPKNLDKISDAAFANVNTLVNLKFNKNLRFIGNCAFVCNTEVKETVLTIPASVKYMGPDAFFNRAYQDIYFQGSKAPFMPYGDPVISISGNNYPTEEHTAFDSHTLMGNSFSATDHMKEVTTQGTADDPNNGWANRENYQNGGAYVCIMHYPNTLTNNDDIDTYVDYTRKYLTETSNFNYNDQYEPGLETTALTASNGGTYGYNSTLACVEYGYQDTYLGSQYVWPSQNQVRRAYITAVNGKRWDGVTSYTTTLSEDDLAIFKEAGYSIDTDNDKALLSKMAHQGTRMFVLANNDAQSESYNPGGIKKDGTWWTLCVPFNMTKKQVKESFGDATKLYLFTSVTREIFKDNNVKHISIRFATDPMAHKTFDSDGNKLKFDSDLNPTEESGHMAGEWNYTAIENKEEAGDDDIVVWAHEAYMVKPMNGENADKDPITIVNYEPVEGNPLPSVVRAQTIVRTQAAEYENCYRFIGNYLTDAKMPQYCYFYGTSNDHKNEGEKFWFLTGTDTPWNANKCVIEAHAHDGGYQDYTEFFGGDTTAKSVKQSTLFGFDENDNSTTGIDDVQIQIGEETLTPIFTLDGKMVSVTGDTTGLAKGVYVKAGKKFVVQ